ncbi:hypothetical protein OSB04_029845 [Centaurea solstitialis]|uniref:Uncharacterized protein n=1 Tax=Centaurea solstitialis TaxID=347529 RepID=A0AA38VSN1_9ASTR|nr:hypothetical protein OSB04_029845 [Centaurea solstitialis]
MESDTERSIVVRDAGRITGGDDAQGSNATGLHNSGGSTVKINSLSIDLGIVKEKGDHAQKCSHFSIRGYAAKMRESGGNNYLPFAHGSEQDLPPIEVPRFRYWLCQSCLQDSGAARTSQEVALVSRYGKSMVQPCATCYSTLDCHGLPILPFGEGTSGLKPADKRNDDERILTVLQGDATQSAPDTPADLEEPDKVDSIDTNVATKANVSAPGTEGNAFRDLDDSKQVGTAKGTLSGLAAPATQPDLQNDDQSGHPRRKARKVRLLTELLCGSSTDEQHQRKENSLPHDLAPSPSSSPLAPLSQLKRKFPQAQDRRSVDVTSQGHVGKKVKTFKGDASVKTSPVGHSRDQGVGHECGQNNDNKYQCKKHGTQRSSKLGKVSSDPVAAWRSIFSDMGRADKQVSVPMSVPPPQPEKKSNASKKILENSVRNQLFDQEDMQRTNVGGSRVTDRQSDVGLGLGLSLHYDPQSQVPNSLHYDPQCQVPNSLPQMPNRVPIQDHSRNAGFFFGESSMAHRVTSDPQSNARSVYEVRDGHSPRTAFLQEQQHYHAQLSHASFSQHQNLVDEKEIVELMAKIQHERNLSEARSYCVPGGSNNNGMPNASSFHKVNFNEGMPIPLQQQYPTMRRPPSSSMMPTGENSLRNPVGFYHQERFPAFPMFDTFSQCRKQPPPNGIRIMEAFSKYHDGTQPNGPHGNAWSNIPSSMPFGHNMEMHTKWSNRNKGKSVINLDLNVMAPNVLDEQNHLETSELNPKHMGSLDSSYSNEAIPAMQLLSLMDAGKSTLPYNMGGKKFNPKPFSCYNHCSPSNPGKPNAMEGSHFPYPPMQSGVKKPIENSRQFNLAHGTSSPSMAVTNSFSSLFHTDQTFEGRQSFHKPPPQKKQRVMSSGSVSHKYRPEDSFAFPLPWHATEDPCERVAPQGSTGPRNVTPRTEICTINQNPADFSTPGPDNVYMIDVEDLKFRGERYYKSKFPLENADGGVNRQKKS